MKRRKTFIGIALVVATLCLGIGYAAISNVNLSITGSASATTSDDNFSVKFDDSVAVVTSSTRSGATVEGTITDDLAATINVSGLTTKGDTATVVYTITNASEELKASLTQGTITNNNEDYFDVSVTIGNNTLDAGGSTTVTVVVTLLHTPQDTQEASITIPITASPVAAV